MRAVSANLCLGVDESDAVRDDTAAEVVVEEVDELRIAVKILDIRVNGGVFAGAEHIVDQAKKDRLCWRYDIFQYPQRVPGVRQQGVVVEGLYDLSCDLEDKLRFGLLPYRDKNKHLSKKVLATVQGQEHFTSGLLQVLSGF